jgi:hypothetical protein
MAEQDQFGQEEGGHGERTRVFHSNLKILVGSYVHLRRAGLDG